MGTKAQAEQVLAKAASRLRKAGAHALQVEVAVGGTSGAEIVAWVDKDAHTLPESVTAKVGAKNVTILVKAKRSKPFKPEKL